MPNISKTNVKGADGQKYQKVQQSKLNQSNQIYVNKPQLPCIVIILRNSQL